MKKILLSAAVISAAAIAITAQTKSLDEVVMTIDGRDVTLGEFEYLYNKNNSQQLTPLTFDEYVDMFINYKLKVADALNQKMDTTASFAAEFNKFRRELAEPYLRDSSVIEDLVMSAYSHYPEEVFVSHIMLPGQDPRGAEKLDSIRSLILNGTITFEDAARENSIDQRSGVNGGRMGWVTGGSMYPWAFEEGSYNTPVGQVSPVVNSGIGYHLIRPEERRPARGEVRVEHLLLLTQGMDDTQKAAVKARIDSLYNEAVKPGADFKELAKKYSEDPGSARNGGDLGWFGAGRMVAPFDSASFAMKVGEISKPVETSYGYHILHKIDQRGVKSLAEVRDEIERMIQNDATRAQMPLQATLDRTAKRTGSSIDKGYKDAVKTILAASDNVCDTTAIDAITASDVTAFTVNGKTTTLGQACKNIRLRPGMDEYSAVAMVDRNVNRAYENSLIEAEMDYLELTQPAFRNLVNEYRDGILLFDISNVKVWDYASKDSKGLNNYFKKNRKKYCTWESPKFKAYVVFSNDSTINKVKEYMDKTYGGKKITQLDQEKLTQDIKDRFGREVRIERVIAAQGENPITDYLGFGAEKPEAKNPNFKEYFAFAAEVINQPEEVSDVKGAVVTDYQSQLENDWVKQLRKKYKVKINNDVLNQAR